MSEETPTCTNSSEWYVAFNPALPNEYIAICGEHLVQTLNNDHEQVVGPLSTLPNRYENGQLVAEHCCFPLLTVHSEISTELLEELAFVLTETHSWQEGMKVYDTFRITPRDGGHWRLGENFYLEDFVPGLMTFPAIKDAGTIGCFEDIVQLHHQYAFGICTFKSRPPGSELEEGYAVYEHPAEYSKIPLTQARTKGVAWARAVVKVLKYQIQKEDKTKGSGTYIE